MKLFTRATIVLLLPLLLLAKSSRATTTMGLLRKNMAKTYVTAAQSNGRNRSLQSNMTDFEEIFFAGSVQEKDKKIVLIPFHVDGT